MVAGLIDEPYHLPFKDIVELTPRQIQFLYYRPRDKKTGSPRPLPFNYGRQKDDKSDDKAKFIEMGLSFGHSIEDLEKQWEQHYNGEG